MHCWIFFTKIILPIYKFLFHGAWFDFRGKSTSNPYDINLKYRESQMTKFKIAKLIYFTTAIVLLGCNGRQETIIKIVDSNTKMPIEGAMVYKKGSTPVLRSAIDGTVKIPAELSDADLHIHAKNYRNQIFKPTVSNSEITMIFDAALANPREQKMKFTRADSLRGSWGQWRDNNDLLYYDLNVKVDVEKKFLSGKNTIRFTMLKTDDRIQLDLFENMQIDSILWRSTKLRYSREFNAVFIDFPRKLIAGKTHTVEFYYSGYPQEAGRFGGLAFKEDSLGNPWVITACQGIGASLWWPNKDQKPDEVDSMKISIAVPSDLMDVSNGRFLGKTDLGDGYTRYDWKVHYPINNYSVSMNIGKYTHFAETHGNLTLDYYVLPFHLEAAKKQFSQVKPMMACFEKFFGPYPFPRDGYKLVEVPYAGMEHQSAVAYGNRYQNGYLGVDWTGVDINTKFDFIIVHESGHEWYGNSVTANDVSDAWIQEGWTTYAEGVYVECLFGYEDAIKYLNGYQKKVGNREPIIGPIGVNHWPTQDQYFKGALFLNTLRHVVDNDDQWWALIKAYTAHFKYKNIWTKDVINYFNDYLKRDLRPLFEQYLYWADMPVLQYEFTTDSVRYRWRANVDDFAMPIKVRIDGKLQSIQPTTQWQAQAISGATDENWQPATEYFYMKTEKIQP